jgi:hypothetical protein
MTGASGGNSRFFSFNLLRNKLLAAFQGLFYLYLPCLPELISGSCFCKPVAFCFYICVRMLRRPFTDLPFSGTGSTARKTTFNVFLTLAILKWVFNAA